MGKAKNAAIIAAFWIIILAVALPQLLMPRQMTDDSVFYIEDGVVYRIEDELRRNQVVMTAEKIEEIIASHPEIERRYYSIIPDKNYYSPVREQYPSIDYDKLLRLMQRNDTSAEYIDIYGCLDIDSYYRTDIHWRQETLLPVAERLCDAMGVPCAPLSGYTQETAGAFRGTLAKQSALPAEDEEMVYLSSRATENAVVTSTEYEGEMPVYTLDKFSGAEPYDIFLSGAAAVITIENKDAATDRELVIFRDSFGSSLAPLLIDSYSKITLIDLRYISTTIIDDYASFDGADVLFIYSMLMINSGGMLR